MQGTLRWLAVLVAVGAMGCDGERIATDAGPGGDSGPIVEVDSGPGPDSGPGCIDGDGDGYGVGCALGADCDDTNMAISPAATDVCNGIDDDCDGTVDEDSGAPSCRLTDGVCAGAIQRCGPDGFLECEAADYGADYEATETACDGLDNDCDGTTDEGCSCTDGMTQACGSDIGLCMEGTQTCTGSAWGPCEGDTGPMGEVCDGADNDCDGASDEMTDLTPPACPLQLGVCAGSVRTCGGVAGWVACSGITSYGGDYEATETLCDGLDNDCDGVTDNGCACVTGTTQPCGTDVGACMAGTQTCTAGSWGACAGETAPVPETCDGVDQNCDGMVDNGVVAPACALTVGVCAGSMQPCAGAAGFAACTATQYGPSYQATETTCDGQDNDCDGVTDEGCACVGGATQACGISTGACERGTQTCTAGAWGACTGGVEPIAELCNGFDDDCNGSSDDALTAPPCALSMGVCAGSTQTCGGAAGWMACAGTASYGPRYLLSEDGSTDETVCDGLDNDCDGTADEGCTSGPIVSYVEDTILPNLYNRHLAFLGNLDGNWDVFVYNVATDETFRLTTTATSEDTPRVYGNHVVYTRGTGAAERVYLYDLTDGSETALTTRQSSSPTIYGGTVVWEEWDGTQWDLYLYDIEMASTTNLFVGGTTANEVAPSLRGNRIAYASDETGTWLTHVIDFSAATPVPVTQTPASMTAAGQGAPYLDYLAVGWTDGRYVTSTTPNNTTDDWDVYAAPFNTSGTLSVYPGENSISGPTNAQLLHDVDGAIFVWSDYRNGNWDPGVGDFSGGSFLLSTHPGHQGDPTISGDVVMWEDNRLGSFDIYGSSVSSGAMATAGDLIINELLADPPAGADVNGDGTADTTQDELVEITNVTGAAVDLGGLTISDATSVRHTFPAGTVLPALGSIVVFGGGTVSGVFGGAQLQIATGGQLGLNNAGDTVTLRRGTTVIDTITYGSAGGNDDALVRTPELDSGTTLTRHSLMAGSGGTHYSPGTSVRGFAF